MVLSLISLIIVENNIVQKYWRDDDTIVSKHVVKLKVGIRKAYGVVCMTKVLKSKQWLYVGFMRNEEHIYFILFAPVLWQNLFSKFWFFVSNDLCMFLGLRLHILCVLVEDRKW
jgi:hypothetical protein